MSLNITSITTELYEVQYKGIIPSEKLVELFNEYVVARESNLLAKIMTGELCQLLYKNVKPQFSKEGYEYLPKKVYLVSKFLVSKNKISTVYIEARSKLEIIYKMYINNIHNITTEFTEMFGQNFIAENADDVYAEMCIEIESHDIKIIPLAKVF